jgi:hypothetical protein
MSNGWNWVISDRRRELVAAGEEVLGEAPTEKPNLTKSPPLDSDRLHHI